MGSYSRPIEEDLERMSLAASLPSATMFSVRITLESVINSSLPVADGSSLPSTRPCSLRSDISVDKIPLSFICLYGLCKIFSTKAISVKFFQTPKNSPFFPVMGAANPMVSKSMPSSLLTSKSRAGWLTTVPVSVSDDVKRPCFAFTNQSAPEKSLPNR